MNQIQKRDLLYKFIKQYKRSLCLWNRNYIQHYNRDAQKTALFVLLKLWNDYEPITLNGIRVKIQGLRTQYHRLTRQVESMSSNSVVYKPTLWYYKHLNFLSGNNDPVSDDSDSDHNDEYVQRGQKRPASTLIDQDGEDISVDPSAAAFGRSVGAQLHQLSKVQRCIAEKLISDVIYHAKMEQLSLETSINVQETVDVDVMIPEAGPSWYDRNARQESPPRELTAEELVKKEIAETESAVSFLQMENNVTESYVFHNVEDEQRDVIDIVKEEFM